MGDFMKTVATILILTMTACSNTSDKQTIVNSMDTTVYAKNSSPQEIKDTLRTSGEREYVDSANFSIVRGKYISGAKFIEVYQNKLTKLDNWKEYYENGQLKEEGVMTNASHHYVGIWKYYSLTGKVDSIVDFDKKYLTSYFEATKIAETKRYKMPNMEVTLIIDKGNTFWQIARWTENVNQSRQMAEVILIDTNTGKVSKPQNQLINIY